MGRTLRKRLYITQVPGLFKGMALDLVLRNMQATVYKYDTGYHKKDEQLS